MIHAMMETIESFLDDAELLYQHGRHRSAYVIAHHSLEEVGRIIMHYKGLSLEKQSDHKSKLEHAVLWIISERAFFSDDRSIDLIIDFIVDRDSLSFAENRKIQKLIDKCNIGSEDDKYKSFIEMVSFLAAISVHRPSSQSSKASVLHRKRLAYLYRDDRVNVPIFDPEMCRNLIDDVKFALDRIRNERTILSAGVGGALDDQIGYHDPYNFDD